MDSNFTITFWIRVAQNPGWVNGDSEIDFPPFTVDGGIQVYYSKRGEELRIYLLHPEMGYRKITGDISKYIQKDTFVALTSSAEETRLYLNGKQTSVIKRDEVIGTLENDDYVMVGIKSDEGTGVDEVLPAKVRRVDKTRGLVALSLGVAGLMVGGPATRIISSLIGAAFNHSEFAGLGQTKNYPIDSLVTVGSHTTEATRAAARH